MTNQIFLVGRLTKQPTMEEKGTTITLAVPRSFKNMQGEYETDFIPVLLWNNIAQQTCEYCKKGDLVGVRGRLEANDNLIVVADKISFLSNNKDLINRED